MSVAGKVHNGIYILEEDHKTFIDNYVKSTIRDLIRVGDYVNGSRVTEINRKYNYLVVVDEDYGIKMKILNQS